jgi:D-lyxose ketol-isomerase
MRRSEINRYLREAEEILTDFRFVLPPLARLEPELITAEFAPEAVAKGLGWDLTDFGSGDFEKVGLLLFTSRNGDLGGARVYGEKILIVRPGQLTPAHHHYSKTEDIINRGGGTLAIQLWPVGGGASSEVLSDHRRIRVDAGDILRLRPGESVTLEPHHWHAFWAEDETTLVGEVSSVNDDRTDNNFRDGVGRFPTIEEDELPYRFLVSDYGRTF